ncbi:MAG TPA: SRPBCC domain-containing protein [Bryobacteraceae bacterium]|nr:SRPBCC domain-containing protein [Bryobacteraceae bacterium]
MRQHETVIEIPATVEEVWKAITEGSEVHRWFAPEVRTDPRVGGDWVVSWGPGMEGNGKIEVFDAPRHLRVVSRRGPDGVPLAMDFYVEGDAGTTTLRLVHSGFLETTDWDGEFNGTRAGWPIFFRILYHGLTWHKGVDGRAVDIYGMSPQPLDRTWELLAPARAEKLAGEQPPYVAWWVWPEKNNALVHVSCTAYGDKTMYWVSVGTFGLSAEAQEQIRAEWQGRLAAIFPEPKAETGA